MRRSSCDACRRVGEYSFPDIRTLLWVHVGPGTAGFSRSRASSLQMTCWCTGALESRCASRP